MNNQKKCHHLYKASQLIACLSISESPEPYCIKCGNKNFGKGLLIEPQLKRKKGKENTSDTDEDDEPKIPKPLPKNPYEHNEYICKKNGIPLVSPTLCWIYQWLARGAPNMNPALMGIDDMFPLRPGMKQKPVPKGLVDLGITKYPILAYFKDSIPPKLNYKQIVDYSFGNKSKEVFDAIIWTIQHLRFSKTMQEKVERLRGTDIIRKAVEIESNFAQMGLVTVVHASSLMMYFFDLAIRRAASRKESQILATEENEFVRMLALGEVRSKMNYGLEKLCQFEWPSHKKSLAVDRAKQMLSRSGDRYDHTKEMRERATSVSYSMFNSWPNNAESTLYFYLENRSVMRADRIVQLDLVPYLTDKERDDLAAEALKLYNKVEKIHFGLLTFYGIPCEHIDAYMYNSMPYGKIKEGSHSASEAIKIMCGEKLWGDDIYDFFDYHQYQARIVDLCFADYGVNRGVHKVLLTESNSDFELIKMEMEKTLEHIIQ